MRLHVEALFVHDAEQRMVRVNEPNGALAPRFFLGRTSDGVMTRVRYDVDQSVREELEAASKEDALGTRSPIRRSIQHRYEAILARSAPVENVSTGPAFCFPRELPPSIDVMLVTDRNAHVLETLLAPWFPDVAASYPLFALTVDGNAVSVCGSVRRTLEADEAGVETVPAYRGRRVRGSGRCGVGARGAGSRARTALQHVVAEREVESRRPKARADPIRQRLAHCLTMGGYSASRCAVPTMPNERRCGRRDMPPLLTPDQRYLVVRGRLWRASNPALNETDRARLTRELMAARRAVAAARRADDPVQLRAARAAVQAAKVTLGERGPVWWTDGAPDYNRHLVKNSPYAQWYAARDAGEPLDGTALLNEQDEVNES